LKFEFAITVKRGLDFGNYSTLENHTHQVPKQFPIKFFLFPSISHQISFVLIKFPENSHQIPLVPINNPSKSFCSHQIPLISINILLFSSRSHQIPLVPINNISISFCSHQVPKKFPSDSSCSHQVRIKIILFPWQVSAKVNGGQSAKLSAAVRGQAGRGATVAGRRRPGAAEMKFGIFCLPGFVEGRGQTFFSRGSLQRFFLPSCARPERHLDI
jgi:hypothetical protein